MKVMETMTSVLWNCVLCRWLQVNLSAQFHNTFTSIENW
jgi:hypothetical protein